MNSIPENTSKNTHSVVSALLAEKLGKNSNKKVLDIPCGAGAFTKRLIDLNIEVHSADIENILQLESKCFGRADMNQPLPFPDNFFEAVVCIDGIEHLENPFSFIRESYRVLDHGGFIIISTPNISALRSRWRWFWTGHHNKGKLPLNETSPSPLHHINLLSYQRLRYILHSNGFEIDKVTTNRVKAISWWYAIFVPFAYLFTIFVYRSEKDPGQKALNSKIIKHLFSKPLLFGETMIIRALKR